MIAAAGLLLACRIATSAPPLKPGITWRLDDAFSDEFNASALDGFKWDIGYRNWSGRDPGIFDPANVSVNDGHLRLDVKLPPSGSLPQGKTYTTASVNTTGGDPGSLQRDFLYGYVEIRAQGMAASTTSAFWLHKNTPDYWTEIDVMELVLPEPRVVPTSLHVIREAGTEVVPGGSLRFSEQLSFDAAQIPAGQTYFNSFHTYGVDWNKDTIDIYVDGVLLRSHLNDRWHHPLSINITNSIQEWNGLPTAAQLAAAEPMLVDYVRVYSSEPRNELDHSGFEYPGAAGVTDAASWSKNAWLQRTNADAHSGEWSVRADNAIPNASGSSQWKKLQPSQNGFEVSPGTAVAQQVWVKKSEEFPTDTATKMELELRWNGLTTGATSARFDVADLPLDQWRQLTQTTLVPILDAMGNPVTFVDVLYVLNNQSESAQMDGTLLIDDAFFGRAIQHEPQLLSGDYNQDGTVNAADYVIWRKNPGGIYTQNDFNIWRAAFGQTAGSGAAHTGVEKANAVPEPVSQTITVGSLILIVGCRRAAK